MTSSHHAPNALGHTRATMAETKGSSREANQIHKPGPSSDRGLQLAHVK